MCLSAVGRNWTYPSTPPSTIGQCMLRWTYHTFHPYFNLKAKGTLDWKPKSISWGLWGHLHFSHWSYWMGERLITIVVISYEQLMFCVNDNLSIELCIVFVFYTIHICILPLFPSNYFLWISEHYIPICGNGPGVICGSMQCSIFTFSL